MSRNIVAVLLGIFVAVGIVAGVWTLNHHLFPLPEGFATATPKDLPVLLKQIPLPFYLMELMGIGMGCFGGAWVVGQIATKARVLYAMLMALLMMDWSILFLRDTPRPFWYIIANFLIYIPPAFLAAKLMQHRHDAAVAERKADRKNKK